MSNDQIPELVLALPDAGATLEHVGGKGASLARMAAAGLPVPPGFHITTAAYRCFVAQHGLQAQILAAAAGVAADQPAALEAASRQIVGLFAQHAMPHGIAEAIRRAYAALGGGDLPVAVRSSATAEDLPGMSFAGQQETYLNMHGEAMLLDAVKRCWASLWTARAIGYRARLRMRRRVAANQKKQPAFIAMAAARCDALHVQIQAASSARELIDLWHADLLPFFRECSRMLEAGARRDGSAIVFVRSKLSKLVGEADANALLSGLSSGASHLASLGPLVGLDQLARGEIDRATYARQYGHRGPHELEVSIVRPAEDADWIDQQLTGLREAPLDVTTLLARQKDAQLAAWERLQQRYPRQAAGIRRRIERAAAAFRDREAARSEVIRVFWALRAFIQRAGALTEQGDAIFFLSIDEILALLGGDLAPLANIPARRTTYARYAALPTYPSLIRGRFDSFAWAADPQRRSDVFDAHGHSAPVGDAITGFPGAAGVVEGRARVIATAEEGEQLQAGEILVTTVTNVGWTPLFPRAAAIVTDIGAPLSHAAIVARELGIPAVVGCGNATMRLHTGDRVRVDGGQGTVELLRVVDAA
ncbi:MAG: PEP/pyruvate-binding domain-containing protein [Roseiflexaceae bacterium]